jgi:hypothetical protein
VCVSEVCVSEWGVCEWVSEVFVSLWVRCVWVSEWVVFDLVSDDSVSECVWLSVWVRVRESVWEWECESESVSVSVSVRAIWTACECSTGLYSHMSQYRSLYRGKQTTWQRTLLPDPGEVIIEAMSYLHSCFHRLTVTTREIFIAKINKRAQLSAYPNAFILPFEVRRLFSDICQFGVLTKLHQSI